MTMSVALYGVSDEQKEQIDNAAIFGADFEEEIDDWSAANFGFHWINAARCDKQIAFLAATMCEVGQSVSHRSDIWVASSIDLKAHPALWTIDLVAEIVQPFASPADALTWFVARHLRTMPYREYLQTAHWGMVRYFARERAGGRCQLCNTDRGPLHTHHRTYERRGEERPDDLIVLCANCHATFHHKLPKGGGE